MSNRTRLNRALALVAGLAALGLVAAGCGSGGSSSADGKVTITLSMQTDDPAKLDPATAAVVQAFQAKNPNITVKLEGQAVDKHQQAMNIAAQSNTLPDIFWILDANARDMAEANKILDLKPMIDAAGIGGNFSPNMLGAYNNGTKQYGLPYQALITGFYYNKDILAANKLQVPVTLDDLVTVCRTVSGAGVTPIAQGANQSSFSVWAFLGMLSRYGYENVYKDIVSGQKSYNNPDFLRLYQNIQKLHDAKCFPTNTATQTYSQAVDTFLQGKSAMLDSGVWSSAAIDTSGLKGKVGFWPGPTFADGVGNQQQLINVPSAPFAVAATVKNDQARYDAVQKFLGFYYSAEGQALLVKNGQPPVTTLKPTVDQATQPTFAAVLAAVAAPGWTSPAAQPDLVVPTAVANAMYDSIYGVIQGALTPQAALDMVDKAFKSA